MHGFVDVRTCKGFEANRRRLTIEQQRHSKEWTYYIAAEEIMWNYAPKMPAYIDELMPFEKLASSKNIQRVFIITNIHSKFVFILGTSRSITLTRVTTE
jgi:hypothetical protein